MKLSDLPANKFPIPFANAAGAGYINTIPQASQIGIVNGKASLTDGFPPLTFQPVGSGGVPPFGQDFNGLLKQITQWSKWQNAGGFVPYDSAFSTAIGGYPKTSVLASASTAGLLFVSTIDDNTNNPDSVSTGWERLALVSAVQSGAYSYAAAGGTANAVTITLSPAPASMSALVGALIRIKSGASANTGAMTLNVNGLGAAAITTETGVALVAGAVPANSFFYVAWDGTQFQKIGGNYLANTNANGTIVQTAPYFIANGVAGSGSYANNIASVSSDLTIAASNFLDAGTNLTSGVLTIGAKDAGVWQFSANLGINANASSWRSKVYIQKNSSGEFGYMETDVSVSPGTGNTCVSGSIKLAAGDTVRPLIIQNTGSTQNSGATGHFSGSRVGI